MTPLSTSTGSEKLRVILLSMSTSIALWAGEELVKVGGVVSISLFLIVPVAMTSFF